MPYNVKRAGAYIDVLHVPYQRSSVGLAIIRYKIRDDLTPNIDLSINFDILLQFHHQQYYNNADDDDYCYILKCDWLGKPLQKVHFVFI